MIIFQSLLFVHVVLLQEQNCPSAIEKEANNLVEKQESSRWGGTCSSKRLKIEVKVTHSS
jgi:hypothetical protein